MVESILLHGQDHARVCPGVVLCVLTCGNMWIIFQLNTWIIFHTFKKREMQCVQYNQPEQIY